MGGKNCDTFFDILPRPSAGIKNLYLWSERQLPLKYIVQKNIYAGVDGAFKQSNHVLNDSVQRANSYPPDFCFSSSFSEIDVLHCTSMKEGERKRQKLRGKKRERRRKGERETYSISKFLYLFFIFALFCFPLPLFETCAKCI